MATARLFFALWPDDALRTALHAHALACRQNAGGRAMCAAKLHMTLVFLGDVARARIALLQQLAAGCASRKFDLCLDKTGCWSRQRVVWIAPQAVPPELNALVAALTAALRAQGFELEDRAWRPHVTLLRDAPAAADLPQASLRWAAGKFVLVESSRGEYRVIGRWNLKAA